MLSSSARRISANPSLIAKRVATKGSEVRGRIPTSMTHQQQPFRHGQLTQLQQRNMSGVAETLSNYNRMARIGALGVGLGIAQLSLGNAPNFFEHKFVTHKKPIDLADFYGTEDFMEIFCVLPFMIHLMMRNAEFDDNGTIHAWGLLGPGELEINIDFDEREIDTTGDGEPDTLEWFQKKERFEDHAPSFLGGFKLWSMTQNFGFHRLEDGTCEVYHRGENFQGFFPVRLLFAVHSRYVIWATEQYVNSEAFGAEDREIDLEEHRQNVPLHVFKSFVMGLTTELEKAKDESTGTAEEKKQIEVTLQRLKTIADAPQDESQALPRLRTLRSHRTNLTKAVLVIEDKETKETIQTAMEQIGSAKGMEHEPVAELKKLARHATIATRQTRRPTRK